MAVPVVDHVSLVECDECPRKRVIVAEQTGSDVQVVVLDGCATCAGSRLLLIR